MSHCTNKSPYLRAMGQPSRHPSPQRGEGPGVRNFQPLYFLGPGRRALWHLRCVALRSSAYHCGIFYRSENLNAPVSSHDVNKKREFWIFYTDIQLYTNKNQT